MSVQLTKIADSYQTTGSSLLNGLLAYWKLDETSGTLYDETINNYDGTGSNLTYQQTTFTNGVYSVSLNGTSSKIVMGSGGNGFPKPTTAGTISLWLKTSTQSDSRVMFALAGNSGMILYWATADMSWMTGDGSATQEEGFADANNFADGVWHLVILSWDGTNKYAYVDGVEKINIAWAHALSWTSVTEWTFGANNYGSGWWTGNLDAIGAWDRALTSGERASLYNSGSGRQYPFI